MYKPHGLSHISNENPTNVDLDQYQSICFQSQIHTQVGRPVHRKTTRNINNNIRPKLHVLILGGLLNFHYFWLHSCMDHIDFLTMLESFSVICQYQKKNIIRYKPLIIETPFPSNFLIFLIFVCLKWSCNASLLLYIFSQSSQTED